MQIANAIQKFIRDEQGVTAIEYGLIAGLISIVVVASATTTGASLKAIFANISTGLSAASTAS